MRIRSEVRDRSLLGVARRRGEPRRPLAARQLGVLACRLPRARVRRSHLALVRLGSRVAVRAAPHDVLVGEPGDLRVRVPHVMVGGLGSSSSRSPSAWGWWSACSPGWVVTALRSRSRPSAELLAPAHREDLERRGERRRPSAGRPAGRHALQELARVEVLPAQSVDVAPVRLAATRRRRRRCRWCRRRVADSGDPAAQTSRTPPHGSRPSTSCSLKIQRLPGVADRVEHGPAGRRCGRPG